MEIKKLLFVTKFEELCFDALRSLLGLRQSALDHVVFLTVIERDKVAMHRGAGYRKEEEIRLRERANIRFIDWAENLFVEGMEVGVYIEVGTLVSNVIDAAKDENADLIVIGRSHKGVLETLYSGSDVTELLRRAATPVLVYKHLTESSLVPEKPFERVVLATDWSPASLRAVELLKPLKNVIQEIHVVHVVGDEELTGSNAMEIQKTRKDRRQRLDEVCEIFEAEGITAEPHVYIGDPEEEIEKAARESQATMIVMGSSGKSAFVERWLGSTPQRIAEKSMYPTLLVPPEQA
ncbi:Universal stress protein family [Olavius algarvensis associated proteobacterium Delta 3]|nr:Universal stress protein family [Olavius algarvensis associated proteobacterium Delta 3]CAB5167773.1 Universal stress protein family [Olavius algarvensis associated proteobacterium Delta 3]